MLGKRVRVLSSHPELGGCSQSLFSWISFHSALPVRAKPSHHVSVSKVREETPTFPFSKLGLGLIQGEGHDYGKTIHKLKKN